MSRWFRFYDDAVNDPKVQTLPGEKFKLWVNLLCLASRNGGVLPALADLSFSLRISVERASSLLDELCVKGLLDPVEVADAPMSYQPHNWDGRQFVSDVKDPTAPDRMKRYRDRKRNDRNATVTVTRPETETETEKNAASAAEANLALVPDVPPRTEAELEKSYFDHGKKVLGSSAGGMLKNLLKAKQGSVALARAALEIASTKSSPREYIGAAIRGQQRADEPKWLDNIPGVL